MGVPFQCEHLISAVTPQGLVVMDFYCCMDRCSIYHRESCLVRPNKLFVLEILNISTGILELYSLYLALSSTWVLDTKDKKGKRTTLIGPSWDAPRVLLLLHIVEGI